MNRFGGVAVPTPPSRSSGRSVTMPDSGPARRRLTSGLFLASALAAACTGSIADMAPGDEADPGDPGSAPRPAPPKTPGAPAGTAPGAPPPGAPPAVTDAN